MSSCSKCGDVGIIRQWVGVTQHREICQCIEESVGDLCESLAPEDAIEAVHSLLDGLGLLDAT